MKKKTIFILSTIIMITITGGLFMEKKKNDDLNMDIQKKRIETYLKYYYTNINTVTITGIETVPTGGRYIDGYINNDEELNFSAWLEENNQFNNRLDIYEGNLKKSPNYDKNYSVDQIEKEEVSTSSKTKVYEANWFNEKYNG